MAALADLLQHCDVASDRHERNAFVLRFCFDGARTTVRITFDDEQSGADVVITNMTTLPDSSRGVRITDPKGKGFGSAAIQTLLAWARARGLAEIQAVQVQKRSERFWTKNGFVALNNITNDFRYAGPLNPG